MPRTYVQVFGSGGEFVPAAGGGAATFDASTSVEEESGDGVLSVNHTCSGSNRALFAGVGAQLGDATASTSCTYNGSAMTEHWDRNDSALGAGINAGYVIAVEAVGTGSLAVVSTLNDVAGRHWLGVISATGVNQTVPAGTANSDTGTASPATVTVASVGADDLVVDCLNCQASSVASIGANQTEAFAQDVGGSQIFRGSYQDGADGGVMSWALNGPDQWNIGAVALKPS